MRLVFDEFGHGLANGLIREDGLVSSLPLEAEGAEVIEMFLEGLPVGVSYLDGVGVEFFVLFEIGEAERVFVVEVDFFWSESLDEMEGVLTCREIGEFFLKRGKGKEGVGDDEDARWVSEVFGEEVDLIGEVCGSLGLCLIDGLK